MSYCVYKHTSPSGKVYIGISGIDPLKRWNCGCGYRSNRYFDSAIKKYGWKNFEHEILKDGLEKEEAELAERLLISQYKSHLKDYGYNIDLGGFSIGKASESTRKKQSESAKNHIGEKNNFYGKRHSDEALKLMSEAKKGISRPREHVENAARARWIRVYQKDIDGNIVAEYDSIIAAAEAVNAFPQNIQRACKKRRLTCRGYVWDYVDGCRYDRRTA